MKSRLTFKKGRGILTISIVSRLFRREKKGGNKIYKVQMPKVTPHVCRHTYCTNMAKSGIAVKTLQYLMGHSDVSITLGVYTHSDLEDAQDKLKRLQKGKGCKGLDYATEKRQIFR